MTVGAVAGTRLDIAPPGASPSPDLYVEIKDVANLGDVGRQFAKIARESIGDGYTRQIKGTASVPAFDLVLNRDDEDPGQQEVLEASENRNALYNFRLVENDGEGVIAASTRILFTGRVYGYLRRFGGVNSLKQVVTSIEIEPDSIVILDPNE
jgi:hypothetical protein